MAVAGVANTTGTEATTGSRTRLAENFDTFLTLLTTQMKNQDPLSPMDSTQFTQQMVQMTGVEQQLLTNDLLQTLVNNSNNGISTAVSLIGKDVRAVTDTTAISGGKAEWVYDFDRDASSVTVEVVDSTGKTVHTSTLSEDELKAGVHTFTWNGKDQEGRTLPDGGAYKLKITSKDSAGEAVPTSIYVQGIVSGVEQAEGQTMLTINGTKVPWDKVASIYQPEPPTEDDPAGDGSNTETASGQTPEEPPINPAG